MLVSTSNSETRGIVACAARPSASIGLHVPRFSGQQGATLLIFSSTMLVEGVARNALMTAWRPHKDGSDRYPRLVQRCGVDVVVEPGARHLLWCKARCVQLDRPYGVRAQRIRSASLELGRELPRLQRRCPSYCCQCADSR